MFNLGVPELLLILVICLLLFGAARLPEIARSLGKSIQEFKRAMTPPPDSPPRAAPDERPKGPKSGGGVTPPPAFDPTDRPLDAASGGKTGGGVKGDDDKQG